MRTMSSAPKLEAMAARAPKRRSTHASTRSAGASSSSSEVARSSSGENAGDDKEDTDMADPDGKKNGPPLVRGRAVRAPDNGPRGPMPSARFLTRAPAPRRPAKRATA